MIDCSFTEPFITHVFLNNYNIIIYGDSLVVTGWLIVAVRVVERVRGARVA